MLRYHASNQLTMNLNMEYRLPLIPSQWAGPAMTCTLRLGTPFVFTSSPFECDSHLPIRLTPLDTERCRNGTAISFDHILRLTGGRSWHCLCRCTNSLERSRVQLQVLSGGGLLAKHSGMGSSQHEYWRKSRNRYTPRGSLL